jgi:hypothetical protein
MTGSAHRFFSTLGLLALTCVTAHAQTYNWYQNNVLNSSDEDPSDGFGQAVSVNGNLALAGAPQKTVNVNATQGQAYIFTNNAGVWSQQAVLTASDGAAGDKFGSAVSLEGNTALIAAPGKNGGEGTVYVFVSSGGVWTQQAELMASDSAASDDGLFGSSVSLNGGVALIGASNRNPSMDSAGTSTGAAYVFAQSGGNWVQQAELTASDAASGQEFGFSVSLSGGVALVGAPSPASQGAAYVFVGSGTAWTQQAKLTPSNGRLRDQFGVSVATDGIRALVGADKSASVGSTNQDIDQGAVYFYEQAGTSWNQKAELVASDGTAADGFGTSVSMSGTAAVIGAPEHTIDGVTQSGAAYVFTRLGETWSQQSELTLPNSWKDEAFGGAVSVDGNLALVSTWYDAAANSNTPDKPSAVYVIAPEPLNNPSFELGSSSEVSYVGEDEGGPSAATDWNIWNNHTGATRTERCSSTTCPSGSTPPAPAQGLYTLHVTTTSAYSGVYQIFPETFLANGSLWLHVVSGPVYIYMIGASGTIEVVASSSGTVNLPVNGKEFSEVAIYSNLTPAEFYVDDVMFTIMPPP